MLTNCSMLKNGLTTRRRMISSGLATARILQQVLARLGCSCFLDYDSIRDGDWRESISVAMLKRDAFAHHSFLNKVR